jgi:hypothetical protein
MNPSKKEIEVAAKEHAYEVCNNVDYNSRFDDLKEDFIAGAEYIIKSQPQVSKDFKEYEKKIQHLEGWTWIARGAWKACERMMQEQINHLKDINFELEQNLLCAQDQNYYFKLMCEYRDNLHEAEKKIQELQKNKNCGNVNSPSSSF